MVKKKEEKLEEQLERQERILSQEEMKRFDLNHVEEKNRKLEIESINLRKEILELRKGIVERDLKIVERDVKIKIMNFEKEIGNIVGLKGTTEQKHSSQRNKQKEFVKELERKFKIEGKKWGFNPETGEIIENEEI
jgi:hypothetical protein